MARKRTPALIAVLAILAACSGGGTPTTQPQETTTSTTTGQAAPTTQAPETTVAEPDDAWGPPETTEIVMAGRLPAITSTAVDAVAIDQGYFAEEGLSVEKVIVEDVRAAIAGGSVDIIEIEPGPLVQAVQEGIDLVAIAGKRCAVFYFMAMQPEIETIDDLEGRDVLVGGLPGDPRANVRLALLAMNGWDLREVDVNYVVVPGGSDAWTELFYENRIAITPFFVRHRSGMIDHGANIVVDTSVEWPNDFYVVRRDFLEENPNTVGRWVRALLRANQVYVDVSNKESVIQSVENYFGPVSDTERSGYEGSVQDVCANLYIDEQITYNALAAEDFTVGDFPPFSEWTDLSFLHQAQSELGLDNSPTPGRINNLNLDDF